MLLVPFQVNLYLKEKSPPLLEATLLVVQTNPPDVFIMIIMLLFMLRWMRGDDTLTVMMMIEVGWQAGCVVCEFNLALSCGF